MKSTKKGKKRLELELTDVLVDSDIDAIRFAYSPPKRYRFDGIEMFPGRLEVRIRKREAYRDDH